MDETFDSYPGFRFTFIHCSGGTYTKPENSNIEGYLLTKRIIFLMACLSPYILMPFGSSVSKLVSVGEIVMPFRLLNKRGDVGGVNAALWST